MTITAVSLEAEVLASEIPVLSDFWALVPTVSRGRARSRSSERPMSVSRVVVVSRVGM